MYNLNGFFDAIGQQNPMQRRKKRAQVGPMNNMDPAMAAGYGAAQAVQNQPPAMGDMGMAAGYGAAQAANQPRGKRAAVGRPANTLAGMFNGVS